MASVHAATNDPLGTQLANPGQGGLVRQTQRAKPQCVALVAVTTRYGVGTRAGQTPLPPQGVDGPSADGYLGGSVDRSTRRSRTSCVPPPVRLALCMAAS